MPKKRRRLWLRLLVRQAPERFPLPGKASPCDVLLRLRDSISDGSYRLPVGWSIDIAWKNREEAPWRIGGWTEEMVKSAAASNGWELAVLDYLEGQIERRGCEGRRHQA